MVNTWDSSAVDLGTLTLASIAYRCRQESARFFKRLSSDSRFCFELFRRAIQEQNQMAWQHVYSLFGPLVSGWVMRHASYQECGEEVGYFVNRAFERLWNAITPEKFSQYTSLPSLLSYLQMCVHSAIVDFIRTRQGEQYQVDESNPAPGWPHSNAIESQAIQRIERKKLWEEISKRLKDDRERTVIHATFVLGLKARQVQALYQDQFPDVRQIYLIRKNVLARLKRDSTFKDLFE